MLTVAHLAQPVDGGVAQLVIDLVRAQTAAGLRTRVLCPPGGELARGAEAAGAEVTLWPAERAPGPRLPAEIAAARRALGRARPDVVHLHSAKAGLAGRLALRGALPTVFQPHAWSFHAAGGLTAALALRWERHGARWAHRLLCVSERERQEGEAARVPGRWAVLPNGVDLARFPLAGPKARTRAREALAAAHGLPPRAPLAVCVGRLCPQKGQDLLLRAWPAVAARVPGARLALVGDGGERAALRRAAGPEVHFAGQVADPYPWYAAADLVVLPSRWEGMALAPLEAMAVGRPVLLTDVAGAGESLPPGQERHCLVPADNPVALAGALVALLGDPPLLRRLGAQAAAHARSAHDVRRSATGCIRLYRELLAERAAPPPAQAPQARETSPR